MHISIFCLAAMLANAPTEETFQSSAESRRLVTTQSESSTVVTRKQRQAVPLEQKLGRFEVRETRKFTPTASLETEELPSLELSPPESTFASRNGTQSAAIIPHRTTAPRSGRIVRKTLPYRRPLHPIPQSHSGPFRLATNPFRMASRRFIRPHAPQSCTTGNCKVITRCPEFWVHRHTLYFGTLYLSARGIDTPYTSPVDGLGANAVPVGSMGVADPTYRQGYQMGATISLSERSSLTANYATFKSHTSDGLSLPGGTNFLRSDVTHPNTLNIAGDSLSARAGYDIDFQNFDFNYQAKFHQGDRHTLNYLVGLRYGQLNQDLSTVFSILGNTTVDTDIEFHGVGPRIGINGKRILGKRGLYLYGQSSANFLLGTFDANFLQQNIAGGIQAATGTEEDRIVPVMELELGIGWKSRCGRLSWRAGYYVGAWFNSITTPTFIDSVQQDRFHDMDESVTFDGLATRLEIQL